MAVGQLSGGAAKGWSPWTLLSTTYGSWIFWAY